jgi:hypothetical protein
MQVFEIVGPTLQDAGVEDVFGVMGEGTMRPGWRWPTGTRAPPGASA